ncbi:MAG: hypothetical protein CL575_09785 [Altererythrobacter sp.]|nr:hypothetical protein [Altererythrobacter sp.]MBK63211.1 hypothetical protein [Altererythrobacter sp.]|tara:strand:+ start:564 stop:2867 length:2304 start_codon:yes stop_codon:yes gene_type:complete
MVANSRQAKACLYVFVSVLAFLPAHASAQASEASEEEKKQTDGKTIIVTGQSLGGQEMASPLAVTVLSGDDLAHRRRGTLGETLEGLPGVHMDNFGAGASRPVIRGQTLPRIEILSDGANVFDAASVSPDHAIVTDPLLLDAIEVQRGPAAIRYGGSAVNGAVNLIDSKVPKTLPVSGIDGAAEIRYGTSDQEMTTAGRVTGAVGPIALHAEGSRSFHEDYGVPEEFGTDTLRDSFAESSTYAFGASLVIDKGYIGAAYTRQDAEYGLPGHSHANGVCHLHGYPFPAPGRIDLHCIGHGNYGNPLTNPDSDTALIDLRSERVDVRGDFADLLPGFSHVRLRGSYTDYQHDEVDGPILYSRYTNEVWDGRIELTHKPLFGFTGTLGVQYTDGTFSGLNLIDLHVPPSQSFGFDGIQNYLTESIGVFLSERRSFGPVDIEIAARKDWRTIATPIPGDFYINLEEEYWGYYIDTYGDDWREDVEQQRRESFIDANPDRKHDPFSASIGATLNVTDAYSIALSLAHTERAPNVRELFADGSSLATNSYEVGLLATEFVSFYLPEELFDYEDDVLERARAVNLTFRKAGGPLEFEVGAFYQDVDNYIFARLLETEFTTGQRHDFLLYTTADAEFYGLDGHVSYQLDPGSRIIVFGDYVATNLTDDDDNLPRIPPGRLGARYEYVAGPLSADVEYYRTFEQDEAAAYETPTDGYNMVNATIAYRIDMGEGANLELYARGSNLTNELAYVHTSFVKDQSPLRGRNVVLGIRTQF